jgi:hypothetical protein
VGAVPPHRAGRTRRFAASEAREEMRRALLAGGSCTVEAGGRRRVLMHDPRVDRPATAWPWPLRLFQRHTVRYVVLDEERRVSSHIYTRPRLDEAIAYFLRDLPAEAPVTIQTWDDAGR